MNDGHILLLKRVAIVILILAGGFFIYYETSYRNVPVKMSVAELERTMGNPVPSGVKAIGLADKISGNEITLKDASMVSGEGLGNRQDVTVVVSQATQIERVTMKDVGAIQKEQDAFDEKVKKSEAERAQDPSPQIVRPELFVREKISLADIKPGDILSVYADGDTSKSSKLTATKIEVQGGIRIPTAPIIVPKV